MKYSNRIEDIDLYLVGACICFAVGGNVAGGILLGFMAICFVGKRVMKEIEDEK